MILSILIPTTPDRFHYLNRLQNILQPQVDKYPDLVEIVYHDAGRQMSTGEKRNVLMALARGRMIVSVDDDDVVGPTYVEDNLNAIISKNPDVVTFCGWMTTDGASRVDFIIKLGFPYIEKDGKYLRFPNHIVPMRKSLVMDFKFNHVWLGEDYEWAKRINDAGVLKTEVHIDKPLYHYDFKSRK